MRKFVMGCITLICIYYGKTSSFMASVEAGYTVQNMAESQYDKVVRNKRRKNRKKWIVFVRTMEIDNYTDREIVKAILRRNTEVTKEFLYRKCYPLFKAIYDKYYTDCESPIELINEIYVYILMPHRETHRSKLQDFGFRCTLTLWLKIVTENYCRQIFAKRIPKDQNFDGEDDSFERIADSVEIEINNLRLEDDKKTIQRILNQMPNARYRRLIELRYLQEKTNEETAELLSMTMPNYYNKHKLAKAQLYVALRKEGLI